MDYHNEGIKKALYIHILVIYIYITCMVSTDHYNITSHIHNVPIHVHLKPFICFI